jgi:hypothetical protein
MKIIESRLRKLEDQLGAGDGKPRILLVVCKAGWGLASIWISASATIDAVSSENRAQAPGGRTRRRPKISALWLALTGYINSGLLADGEVVRGELCDAANCVLQINARAEMFARENADHDVALEALQNANIIADVW